MRNPSEKLIILFIAVALIFLSAFPSTAQTSNQIWFVVYNGAPTPSSDVSARTLISDGSSNSIVTGTAKNFVSQTNFSSFHSPYDIAVDPAMGKVYVLDNNLTSSTHTPEYIYSFNISGTSAQIAASAQIIYTMPIPAADTNAGYYPLISGIALDRDNHLLYFNQYDFVTPANSYIGQLDLASSSNSNIHSFSNGNPTVHTFYSGKIPGWGGQIAVDATNIYLSAYNTFNGNSGIYTALLSGSSSTFTEIITNSLGDTTFSNGCADGVVSNPKNDLIYYLTFNPMNTNQNAVWFYNTTNHLKTKIASGFRGFPDNITLDAANNRYYFTVGQDATRNPVPANHQAIYTGSLGSTNAPTILYIPALSGQDTNGGANAGIVAIGGIYVMDFKQLPVASADFVNAQKKLTLNLSVADLLKNDSDPEGGALSISSVSNVSTNGGSVSLSDGFVVYTPANNFTGHDQFTYTLASSSGEQTQGIVTVNVLSLGLPPTNHLSIALASGDCFFLFAGDAGQDYVVQFADSLNGPWQELSPILTAGTDGFIEYNDLNFPSSATRFYRVRVGP